MTRALLAGLIGIVIGVVVTLTAIDVVGGWWEYRILDAERCQENRSLGTAHVAPHQPNPCLIRQARFVLISR